MSRISRTKYYMMLARTAALRSTCERRSVGCVLVDMNTFRVKSIGYNGAPKDVDHCTEKGCLVHRGHCIRTIHAEINALSQLRGEWEDLVCYITDAPCYSCYQALVAFKVRFIYYLNDYEDKARDKLVKIYKVPVIKVDG